MADFLLTEAVDEDTATTDVNDEGNIDITLSDEEFIDDSVIEQDVTEYYGFTNVSKDYTEAVQDSFSDFDYDQEANNYCVEDDLHDIKIDEFKDYKSRVDKFAKTLLNPQGLNNKDSFFCSILFAIRYRLTDKFDIVDNDEQIKADIGAEIFDEIYPLKDILKLDLDILNFENQCNKINQILNRNSLFLRVFEFKQKFHCLIKQDPEKKNVVRELSACIVEKFNGFATVRLEFDRKLRQKMSPIDIIYKPVKKENEIIECFFSSQMNLAYRASFNDSKGLKLKHGTAFQCYYCSHYFARKDRFDRHIENCTGIPGFVYNFNSQNLLTFEENLKFKRDIPLTVYIDFETTAPTDDCLDPETKKMNVVSYVIIFAFHPKLKMKRVIIERSFGNSLQKLTTIDYLTNEQLKFKDVITLKQLRDCALSVFSKKNKIAISEIFSTELKFATDCLLKWFNSKYKNSELSIDAKRKYEIENPIDWQAGKCQICNFPLHVNPTKANAKNDENMSYGDFIIEKEHKFLRNIFSKEEIESSVAIKNIESFHEHFCKFLQTIIFAQQCINSMKEFSECFYDELTDCCNEYCKDCVDFIELKEKISDIEVKSKQKSKIPKFTLQLYAFVYQKLMCFPTKKFECETITTKNLFETVHKIINVKIHLHHSHVTGEIIGYVHDFCNWQVRENNNVVSCIAHNFFKFDLFFLLKNIRLSVWRTKDINTGGKNLTDINFASIDNFKFIDTMKYYQTSLGQLSETMSDEEIQNIAELTVQFINNHEYFSTVWKNLTVDQKNKIIKIIVSGKGVIPYEKIETIDSLSQKPEDGIFFSKDEFFSSLKNKMVDDESYENAKQLLIILKMRDLSDLNDLCNAQDVIIFLEIIENRFQKIQDKTGYNPRIINSASKLSGCIQREKSKCILALPIDNTQMEIFEKTLCGGFSSVNTRLSFDTELLMPNLKKSDYEKMNIDESFKAFKRDHLKVVYSLKLDDEKSFQKKRVITKIIKFDENNQYGFAMTRPMPTGCIKQNNSTSWLEFNLLLEKVSLDDSIGHLFIVDIEFDEQNATKRQYMYNEIFPPIIEKQKTLEANERSLFQLLELFDQREDKPKSYRCTAKSHATMFPKTCIPLYVEDLRFLIKRAGWVVTKLYSHFTFE